MMGKLKQLFGAYREVFVVLLGEIIVSLLTCAVFALIGAFDYRVATGAALGSVVTVMNLFILSFSINRAVNKYLALRGDAEMTEEEADAFAAENAPQIKLAAGGTYILRNVLMLLALVGAFLLGDYFNVIATVIPLLAYRPILYVSEIIRSKLIKNNPTDGDAVPNASEEEGEVE